MMRWPFLVGAAGILIALAVWRAEPVYLSYLAGKTEPSSLADRVTLLAEHVEIHLPEGGEARYPVALMFHGCAGPRMAFQRQWADVITEAGYGAVIIDSVAARGLTRKQALDQICKGEILLGQERAGDVLAAYKIAAEHPRLDVSRLALAGWSHGAWTIMDFMTMDMEKRRPAGLTDDNLPMPKPERIVLFYPYCGSGALSRVRPWEQSPETLALLGDADSVVDAEQCIRFFSKKQRRGANLDLVVYPGAEHVFDDPFLEPDWIHWYNEEDHEDATARVSAFLSRERGEEKTPETGL